jgi:16S rRNA (cytidine1402-2'-O)-methyltransferase
MSLAVVGTPIGNLGDITVRGLETLKAADLVACEDTRVTKRLLDRYGIRKPMLSLHQQSRSAAFARVVDAVGASRVVYVTDAGTPGISDPGGELVAKVSERYGDRVPVEVIPGPSALTAAVSVAGIPTDRFLFLGFLPHKKGRQRLVERAAKNPEPVVLYESPHRVLKTLDALAAAGAGRRRCVVARELTKIHEEVQRGTVEGLAEFFRANPGKLRGEFALIVEGESMAA